MVFIHIYFVNQQHGIDGSIEYIIVEVVKQTKTSQDGSVWSLCDNLQSWSLNEGSSSVNPARWFNFFTAAVLFHSLLVSALDLFNLSLVSSSSFSFSSFCFFVISCSTTTLYPFQKMVSLTCYQINKKQTKTPILAQLQKSSLFSVYDKKAILRI